MTLDEIQEMLDAATPGPWEARVRDFSNTAKARHIWSEYGFIGQFDDGSAEPNARLIAACPQLIQALLDVARAAYRFLPGDVIQKDRREVNLEASFARLEQLELK